MSSPAQCRCGHTTEAHEHYREGDDCGACQCRGFAATNSRDLAPIAGLCAVLLAALIHR